MLIDDIATARYACVAAWAPWINQWKGQWGWHVHHAIMLEPLRTSPLDRIDYIASSKSQTEQVARLNNFRPVQSPLPEDLATAGAVYVDAYMEYRDIRAVTPIWPAPRPGWVTSELRPAAYLADTLWRRLARGIAEYATYPECKSAHDRDVPGSTWNGRDIFGPPDPLDLLLFGR